ncbi:MAG TPA: hypothetical protein VIM40_01650 [Arthrobacter sp.]|jgi:cobalamin biosynthesis protein CobD/CbiB
MVAFYKKAARVLDSWMNWDGARLTGCWIKLSTEAKGLMKGTP